MATPQDFTGTSPASLITETIYPQLERFYLPSIVIPAQAPFFDTANFSVVFTDAAGTARTLVLGTDYEFTLPYLDGVKKLTTAMYGAIYLTDNTLVGSLTLVYQSIGGAYIGYKDSALISLARKPINALSTWDVVSGTPIEIPVQISTIPPDVNSGYSAIVAALSDLTKAITQTPAVGVTPTDPAAVPASAMHFRAAEHVNNFDNPHGTTLAQLGISLALDADVEAENPTDGILNLAQAISAIANAIPVIDIPVLEVTHGLYETSPGSNLWSLTFTTSAFKKKKGKPTPKNGTLKLTNLIDPSKFATCTLTAAEITAGVTGKSMNVPIVIDPVTGSGVTWLATLTYYANETKAVPVTAARNIDDKYGVSTVISVTGSVNLPDGRGFSVSSGDSLDFGFIASRSTGDVDLDFTTIPSNGTTNLIGARKNIDLDKEASAGSKSVLVMFIGQYIDGGDGIPIREYNTVVNTTSGDHGLDLSKTIRFSNVRNTFINNIIKFTKTTGSRLWTVSMLAEDYGVTGKTTQTLAPSGYSYLDVARFRSNANNGWVLKIINQPPDYKFNLAVRMQDPNGAVHDYRLFTTPTVTSGYTDLNVDMASSGGYKFEKRSSNPAEYVIGEWSVIGVRYDWSPQDYWFDDPATSTDLMYCMIRSFTPGKRKFSIPYVAPIPPVIVETATGTDAVNTSSTGQGFLTSGYNDSTGTPVGATGITRVSFIDDSVSGRSNTLKNLNSKSSSVSNLTKGWVIGGYSQFNALVSAVSQSVEEMDLVSVTTNICQASADGRALAASVSSANNGYVISGLVGGAPQAVGTTLVFNFTSRASTTTTAAVAKGNNCGVMSNDYGYSAGGDWWTYTRRDNEKISFATSTTLGTISAMLNADKGRMYGLSSKVTGKGYFAYGIMSAADAGKAVESIDFYTDTNIRVLATAGSGSQRGSIQSHDAGYTCDTGGVQKIVFLTETAYTSTSDLITRDFTTGLSANPWTY